MSDPRSCCLYLRVSTEEQTIAGQEAELRAEAARLGLTVVERYAEVVTATGRAPRTEYDRLMRDAADPGRPWGTLLVWALDRFSRAETFTQATAAILELERLGVQFVSFKEPSVSTPSDGVPNLGRDVLLALLPVISSFESKRRSERTRVAMWAIKTGARATRSGKPVGAPRKVTFALAVRVWSLRKQGYAWRDVASRASLKRATARAALRDLKLGRLRPDGETIVPPELAAQIAAPC